ncbi:MAG: hypothetical protein IPJ34_41310 [Myxococcales bacterium]|nr:hypothetical protein [Myxococcales bacterium]
MSFASLQYAAFFAAIFVTFWGIGAWAGRFRHLLRTLLLVLASAWFYTRFDYGPAHPRIGWAYSRSCSARRRWISGSRRRSCAARTTGAASGCCW